MTRRFRIAADGEWKGSFRTAEEAKVEAARLADTSGSVVYVAKRTLLGMKFLTAFPLSIEKEAREVWKSTRSYGGGTDGILVGGDGGGGGGDGGGGGGC